MMFFESRPRLGVRALASALLVFALAGALPAAASELPSDPGLETAPTIRLAVEHLDVPAAAHPEWDGTGTREGGARTMWMWSGGRRGYFLGGLSPTHGYSKVVSVDLDTLEPATEVDLVPPGLGTGHNMAGHSQIATVDTDNGRLFVAYEVPRIDTVDDGLGGTLQGLSREGGRLIPEGTYPAGQCDNIPPGNPGSAAETARQQCERWAQNEPPLLGVPKKPEPELVTPAASGSLQVCPSAHTECFGGLHVLDGETLQPVRRIEYQPIQIDGGAVTTFLRALSFQPATEVGDETVPAKVYALVEEATGYVNDTRMTRTHASNLLYAVQFDPETGTQDWALRVDQCRGARESRSDGTNLGELRTIPHAATVYRTTRGGEPVVVLGCHSGGTQVGTVVRVPLTVSSLPQPAASAPGLEDAGSAVDAGDPEAARALMPETARAQSFAGPDQVWEMLADPASDRVLMKVVSGNPQAEVWWVFDGGEGRFVGTIGIGTFSVGQSVATLDASRGRLYVRAGDTATTKGALFAADIRRTPLSQALTFSELARPSAGGQMVVDDGDGDRPTRVFAKLADRYEILLDRLPVSTDLPLDDFAGRTLDLDELEGVTSSTFDGVARGYGMRALFVGGLEAATRVGPVDAAGQAFGAQDVALQSGVFGPGGPGHALKRDGTLPVTSPCTATNREVVLGMVGPESPAVVDTAGARGAAEPVIVDTGLRADSEAPASRCLPIEWNEVWRTALFNNPPAEEPTTTWKFGNGEAACVSTNEKREGAFGDAVTGGFAARVRCDDEAVSGWSYARGANLEGGVVVGEASSSFTVYRDPGRGVVARVESIARGVKVPGAFTIDMVRTVAESWANGRAQLVADEDQPEGYDPNCDMDRTAGTCLRRQISGVSSPAFRCGQCGDQRALIDGLNGALGSQGTVQLREPDVRLAKGAENGFTAAVKKPDAEQFADLVLNNDLLQTVLPGLEIVRYAQPNRVYGGGQRGRQVYQFAGVEVSSAYGIQCLLVYDAATNTCAGERQQPGSIQITLSDPEGKPLVGGAFEVRADVDADGVLGLKDTLLPDGACVTAEDGVGTCTFEGLQPGSYLVNQVAAPPGYAKTAEPWVSEVASGERRTVAFTNVSNMSRVELKATDEHGAPVAGAVFAAYPDPDSDGKVAPEAKPAAECTTDAEGVCVMQLPAGSYVLVQTSAPGGLEGIDPVAFTFASGGQVAAVTVVNYPPEQPAAPEGSASPVVDYSPPVDHSPPVEVVDEYVAPEAPAVTDEDVPLPQVVGDTITRVVRAPGDALRLMARDPMEAAAWVASLALFVAAVLAIRRRQQAAALIGRS